MLGCCPQPVGVRERPDRRHETATQHRGQCPSVRRRVAEATILDHQNRSDQSDPLTNCQSVGTQRVHTAPLSRSIVGRLGFHRGMRNRSEEVGFCTRQRDRRIAPKRLGEPPRAIARRSKVAKFTALGIGNLGNVAKIANIFAVRFGILCSAKSCRVLIKSQLAIAS